MCDQHQYDKLRERVTDLEKTQAAQTEQIKTLFATATAMQQSISSTFRALLWGFLLFTFILVLCLAYGALGEKGFNSVTKSAEKLGAAAAAHSTP